MNDDDRINARRLHATLNRKSRLSLDEARSRLPELVMAALAGDDVERAFADVLVAIDQYPELAEDYAMLVEEMETSMDTQAPLPMPVALPQFFAPERRSTPGIVLRRIGEQLKGLLVQLAPKPVPEPLRGVLSESSAMYLSSVEYISEWVIDGGEPVQITAVVQQVGTAWELVVSLIPGSAATWHVSATLGEDELPIVSRDRFVTRFGPLDEIPQQPFTLVCMPDTL